MTEYIIIVALVAIALITIVTMFGNKVKFLFQTAVQSLDNGKVEDVHSITDKKLQVFWGKEGDLKKQNEVHTAKKLKSGAK